jgi:glycosyltransferase involved in cell wall biosynthesis
LVLERKGLDKIVEIAQQISDDWNIKIIGQGKGEERLREFLRERGCDRLQINQFIPPWEVSSVLKEFEYVFCLTVDEPIPSFLNTLIEAVICGATVVVGSDFDLTQYQDIISNIYDNILVVPLDDPSEMTNLLLSHWKERQNKSLNRINILPMYQSYIDHNLRILHPLERTL